MTKSHQPCLWNLINIVEYRRKDDQCFYSYSISAGNQNPHDISRIGERRLLDRHESHLLDIQTRPFIFENGYGNRTAVGANKVPPYYSTNNRFFSTRHLVLEDQLCVSMHNVQICVPSGKEFCATGNLQALLLILSGKALFKDFRRGCKAKNRKLRVYVYIE
ncbi:hypothetical protein POUND7_016896 [Theobroma cacao]